MTKKLEIKKNIDAQIKDLLEGVEKAPNEFIEYMISEIKKNKIEQEKTSEYLNQLTQEHNKTQNKLGALSVVNATHIKDIKFWLEKE